MGAQVSACTSSSARLERSACSPMVPRKFVQIGYPKTGLDPFNHADRLRPVWSELASFRSLPPAEHFHRNLPEDSSSALIWSLDVHFLPRSERRLVVSFAAHLPRQGMTPAPVNQYLSGGCIGVWRIDSSDDISYYLLPRLQSMSYPCRLAVHPSRPTVCFPGIAGLTLVDLTLSTVNGLHRLTSAGKPNMGEVVKSVALSPDGSRALILLRLAGSFHLRIVRFYSVAMVESEVRLCNQIPCLRLGRTYTETGHCAWSCDASRVGFASSTGHYGVLLLKNRQLASHRSSLDDVRLYGESGMTLEWCRRPADGDANQTCRPLSSIRAFTFWPVDPSSVDFDDDNDDLGSCETASCRYLLVLGDTSGCLNVVGGFVACSFGDFGEVSDDEDDDDYCEEAVEVEGVRTARDEKLATVQRVLLESLRLDDEAEDDAAEVAQFSCSGRLLSVGCRSGAVRIYQFHCQRRRRREGEVAGEAESDYAARAGISVSLQLLRILEPSRQATGTPPVSYAPPESPIVSLAFADTEEVLASADASGFVRLWRLPPPNRLIKGDEASFSTVSSLVDLCSRAAAARCRIGRANQLPLPPSLLPSVCPNFLDRWRACRPRRRSGHDDADDFWGFEVGRSVDGTKVFSIKLF